MAQISPKACLFMLFITIQSLNTTETSRADQSPPAISMAKISELGESNSARLTRFVDQAINTNRLSVGSIAQRDVLNKQLNPLRNISPLQLPQKKTEPAEGESSSSSFSPAINLLDKKIRAMQNGLAETNRRIRPTLEPISNLVQRKFEETISDFCTQLVIPKLNSLDIQLRSALSNAWKQAPLPRIENNLVGPSPEDSPATSNSPKLDNAELVLLPADTRDHYWQYYQDCDRWGVNFSDLEVATQKANEIKIARSPISINPIKVSHRTHEKVTGTEHPSLQANQRFFENRFLRLANESIIDSRKFIESTMLIAERTGKSVNHWAAVIEFQAVETALTDYSLFQTQKTATVRVANQFDLLALGIDCISRAIKHSERMGEDASEHSPLERLPNAPAPIVSE